ncbi:tyrosine-type recombinase/integrase [Cryobacterium sp. GrIS_2_6]|uniref:tyrosine-type recombinase/integrase n=1 Tax=Cryobacterium sp. GrIS_2_6 TaxID=3162785 RepID=UPI002E03E300|nr:tyrosine-type recombinase/integrase [Cryobacterium psychrotolerans]MEC5152397.1 integrase [Cryobacterium psychrotolerans]
MPSDRSLTLRHLACAYRRADEATSATPAASSPSDTTVEAGAEPYRRRGFRDGTATVSRVSEEESLLDGGGTAGSLFAITSAVLSYAHKAGWLPVNPANGVELPTILRAHHIYLSYAEVELLADAAFAATSDETDRVLIHTLAYTGMRINEALALTVGDLSLETRRATVKATWSLNAAGERVTGTPKTGSTGVVPLQPFLVDELRALTTGRSPGAYVFQGPRGGPIHDHNWRSRTWRLAVLGSGLDILGLTRTSCATQPRLPPSPPVPTRSSSSKCSGTATRPRR